MTKPTTTNTVIVEEKETSNTQPSRPAMLLYYDDLIDSISMTLKASEFTAKTTFLLTTCADELRAMKLELSEAQGITALPVMINAFTNAINALITSASLLKSATNELTNSTTISLSAEIATVFADTKPRQLINQHLADSASTITVATQTQDQPLLINQEQALLMGTVDTLNTIESPPITPLPQPELLQSQSNEQNKKFQTDQKLKRQRERHNASNVTLTDEMIVIRTSDRSAKKKCIETLKMSSGQQRTTKKTSDFIE
jgi:hypothetical protein